jgi:hypothetical protein
VERERPEEPREKVIAWAALVAAASSWRCHDMDVDTSFVAPANGSAKPAVLAAADFVRKNPGAPADAIPIHLKMKGHAVPQTGSDQPGRRVRLAWTVFQFVLVALDEADRLDAAEAAGRAIQAQRGRPQAVPRGQLADPPPDHDPRTDIARAHARKTGGK